VTELEIALAQVFRRKGKMKMAEKDFVFAASLDFRWFSPKEAQVLMEMGLEAKLLTVDGGMLTPTFDFKALDIPKGYAPTADLLKQPVQPAEPKGDFMTMVDLISREKGMESKDVISIINRTQDSMGIEIEVAALIVARDMGLDISGMLDKVEENLGNRCRK